jgi:uncharacterized protein (TIGR02611 family)
MARAGGRTPAAAPSTDSAVPRFTRLRAARQRVRDVPGGFVIWRVGITLVGLLIIAIGIVLLPLPGPGWLIIFAGLGTLATEYQWAMNLLLRLRSIVTRWTVWASGRSTFVKLLLGVLSLVFLAAIALGAWWLYRAL